MVKYYYIDDYLYSISVIRTQIFKHGSEFFAAVQRENPGNVMSKEIHELLETFRGFSEFFQTANRAFFDLKADYLKAGKTDDENLYGEFLERFENLKSGFDLKKSELKEFYDAIVMK